MQPLDAKTLDAIGNRYDLGHITAHWPAAHGIENRNYFLTCARGNEIREYVLTMMEQPANAGELLVPLLDACRSAGLPVAAVVRTRVGAPHAMIDGRATLLCHRLPGRHVINPTETQVAAIGRFLARLHSETVGIGVALAPYPRDLEWLTVRAEACQAQLPWVTRRLLLEALGEVAALLERREVRMLPRGTLHGDLFRDNALFDRWGLSGVLDFHHAARGICVYDVAITANDWCVDPHGAADPARLTALLRGYHSIRPFERDELWLLSLFMLYAALAFWLSRLTARSGHCGKGSDRFKDAAVFERIVSQRRQSPTYPDWWSIGQKFAARDR